MTSPYTQTWSWRRLLKINLAIVPPVTVLTGLAVRYLLYGFGLGDESVSVVTSIVPAFVYTLIMVNMQFLSGYLAFQRIPITSTSHAAMHVAIQSATTLFSFLVATAVVGGIHVVGGYEPQHRPDPVTLGIIGTVAFVASVVCNTAFYLFYLYRRARLSEQAALHAELQALKAQINPHFLFNSLNSIAALIRSRPSEAEAVTEHLAELFRYSLRASRRTMVTLGEEIESIKTYLEIERARFRDRLHVEMAVDEVLLGTEMPGLILQPLVENAVKHGVSAIEGKCTISVDARRSGPRVIIEVTDTGPGFPTDSIDEILARGTGLGNVRQRLSHAFGPEASLDVIDYGVRVSFPMRVPAVAPEVPPNGAPQREETPAT